LFVGGFDSFTVTTYFNLLFIALEMVFVRSITFNVYDDILKELKLTRYFKLMEILRLVRNAMTHQNGIHDGNDKKLDWGRKTITFTKGKGIDYGGEVW
jgi:hypothetical protein